MFLDGDTLIFIDFRSDRMRQIVEAFGIKPQFETDKIPKDIVSGNSKCVYTSERDHSVFLHRLFHLLTISNLFINYPTIKV